MTLQRWLVHNVIAFLSTLVSVPILNYLSLLTTPTILVFTIVAFMSIFTLGGPTQFIENAGVLIACYEPSKEPTTAI